MREVGAGAQKKNKNKNRAVISISNRDFILISINRTALLRSQNNIK